MSLDVRSWTVANARAPSIDVLERVLLAGVLVAVIASHAPGTSGALSAADVAYYYVLVAGGLVLLDGLRTLDGSSTVLGLVATGVVMFAILQVKSGGVPETDRALQIGVLLALFLAYPFVRRDGLDRLRRLAPFVLGAGLVVGVHFHHSAGLPSGSGLAGFPLFTGFIVLANLFFIPRYVSREGFLWAVSRVAAVAVLAGLFAYLDGPYPFFGMEVELFREPVAYPLVSEVDAMRSVFPNPNGLGLLTFAGTVAAGVELHERYDSIAGAADRSPLGLALVAVSAVVTLVCGVGLVLSGSRGAALAAGVGLGVYAGAVSLGRDSLPLVTGVVVGGLVLVLAAMFVGILPIDPGNRFVLWGAAIEAYLANPTLYGEGIVGTGDLLVPYHALETQPTPHNSYLQILLRVGLVGLVGYLLLVLGSLVDGLLRPSTVDLAAFVFALGFAVNQLFEAYSLFHFTAGAVLASLAVGFLIHGRQTLSSRVREQEFESPM